MAAKPKQKTVDAIKAAIVAEARAGK